MKIQIFHNTTTVGDLAADGDAESIEDVTRDPRTGKRLAIFSRFNHDDSAPIEPGDRLTLVGELDVDATDDNKAAHIAFEAGNAPWGPHMEEYRSWGVRSLSVGDVVITENKAFACASLGWQEIDHTLAAFKVTRYVTSS